MVLLDLLLKLLVWLDQGLSFTLDLVQESLVLVLFFVKFRDLVSQLLDQVKVCGCDFGVVGLDV